MTTPRPDDERELTAAYALDALTEDERIRMERASSEDADIRGELDGFQDVAAQLGAATRPVAPSAELRASILDRIADLRQDAPAPAESAPAVSAPAAVTRVSWIRRPAVLLTAAAAAVALFIGGVALGNSLLTQPQQSTTAQGVAQIAAAPDVQRTSVSVDGMNATLMWSDSLARSAVTIDGLASLPSDRVYEAWYIGDSGAIPAGTFASAGSATSVHVLDGAMGRSDAVGITIEPAGGSTQPTTTPILLLASS